MKQEGNKLAVDLIQVLMIATLFIVILLLVTFSATAYRSATEAQSENDHSRSILSYINTTVRNNGRGEVKKEFFDDIQGLVIANGDTGYEQRIYKYDRKLRQEYVKHGAPADPEHALIIGDLTKLNIDYLTDSILRVETDEGITYINIAR